MKFKPGNLVRFNKEEFTKYLRYIDTTSGSYHKIDYDKIYTVKLYNDNVKNSTGIGGYDGTLFLHLAEIDGWIYHEACLDSWKQHEFQKQLDHLLNESENK